MADLPLIKINSAQAHRNLQYSKLYEIDNDQEKGAFIASKKIVFARKLPWRRGYFF